MDDASSTRKMSWQKKLFWVGSGIFFVSIVFLCVIINFSTLKSASQTQNTGCNFTFTQSLAGIMNDQESKILTVTLQGQNLSCTTRVRLAVTDFDTDPPDHTQNATIIAHQKTKVVWVLKPKSQGNFSYFISFPDKLTQSAEGSVTVNNAIGLPAWTTFLAPVAVVILGPMLTIPYWFEKGSTWLKKRKVTQKPQKKKPGKKPGKR